MLRTVLLLATCATPLAAQVNSTSRLYTSLQFTHLKMRGDDGTVQGASGAGLTLRLGARPFAALTHLATEGAVTFIPRDDSPFESHPRVWAVNLGAIYSLAPLGAGTPVFNPFGAAAVGIISYDGPPDDPNECRIEEGCLDESPDLHGTKASVSVGGGTWIALIARLSLRAELRLHHRLGAESGEAAWNRELAVGVGYRF